MVPNLGAASFLKDPEPSSDGAAGLCLTDSVRYDTFLDLSLEVHQSVSVDEALRSFTDVDVLEGDNTYDCTVCKTKTCATKTLTLNAPGCVEVHRRCHRACWCAAECEDEDSHPRSGRRGACWLLKIVENSCASYWTPAAKFGPILVRFVTISIGDSEL